MCPTGSAVAAFESRTIIGRTDSNGHSGRKCPPKRSRVPNRILYEGETKADGRCHSNVFYVTTPFGSAAYVYFTDRKSTSPRFESVYDFHFRGYTFFVYEWGVRPRISETRNHGRTVDLSRRIVQPIAAVCSPAGDVRFRFRLPGKEPEGITFLPNGDMLVAQDSGGMWRISGGLSAVRSASHVDN